jgi:hypothetical protein
MVAAVMDAARFGAQQGRSSYQASCDRTRSQFEVVSVDA